MSIIGGIYYHGQNCVPYLHVEVLTPVPQNVTAFGQRVFKEITSIKRVGLLVIRVGLNPI